jgi:hypothetical protein
MAQDDRPIILRNFDRGGSNRTNLEHPALTTWALGLAAQTPLSVETQAKLYYDIAVCGGLDDGRGWGDYPLAIPDGVAEVFAARLGPKVGVKVAPATLSEKQPTDFRGAFIKSCFGGFVISERAQNSLPIYFLDFAGKLPNPVVTNGAS